MRFQSTCLLLAFLELCFAQMQYGGPVSRDIMCGISKGCYHDCSGNSCTFLITWTAFTERVDFTISYDILENYPQWIALGLSRDVKMGSDSVIECVILDASGTSSGVFLSYNADTGKSNSRNDDPKMGIISSSSSIVDGVFTCSLSRNISINDPKVFNLNDDYYLLFANGRMSGGLKMPHSKDPLPGVSPKKVDFQTKIDLSRNAKFPLVKAHGCLMVFAWVFAASIGIVMARYYKLEWPGKTLCKEKVWFQLHRGLMVTAFACVVAAFIIIFIDVMGWSYLEGSTMFQRAHPILGVIVTALAVINPILALLRPHRGTRIREIFSWSHWFIGTVAHILSVLTMIIGVLLSRASTPIYAVWILIAYAVYQFLIEIILEIHECTLFRRGKPSAYRNNLSTEKYRQPWEIPNGSLFRRILLGLHVIIITAFTVVLIVIIVIH
ncbi:hypothetical protein ACJMK2_042455 [Sinanodonta woodiana]|uniref:Ferric-chelate reductase 1 n=1 Tax=Sinanodonta woodiana TaxID=1069815 RepID=A0ABD3W7D7_SINWO